MVCRLVYGPLDVFFAYFRLALYFFRCMMLLDACVNLQGLVIGLFSSDGRLCEEEGDQ